MANCSTLTKLFHEKGAQDNGKKNKVKLFFQKKIVPRRTIVPRLAKYLQNPVSYCKRLAFAGPGRVNANNLQQLFHDPQIVPRNCSTLKNCSTLRIKNIKKSLAI